MISFYIQKGINTNKVLFDDEILNNKEGLLLRITNKDFKHKYYFIENKKFYLSVLFNKNKPKVILKDFLKTLNLVVIPYTSKNVNIVLSKGFIELDLIKWENYKGLF